MENGVDALALQISTNNEKISNRLMSPLSRQHLLKCYTQYNSGSQRCPNILVRNREYLTMSVSTVSSIGSDSNSFLFNLMVALEAVGNSHLPACLQLKGLDRITSNLLENERLHDLWYKFSPQQNTKTYLNIKKLWL